MIKGKFKITISKFGWGSTGEYNSPEYVISKGIVNFYNKAYQNLFKNLGMKGKSTQDSYYNDLLLSIYPHVQEYFTNFPTLEACKKGEIDNIDLHIFIQLADGFGYRLALYAYFSKNGSSKVNIYPPFEKQVVERSIPDEKDSIPEKENKVEEKKDKYPPSNIICFGILFMMLACVILGLIRAIYYLTIN